MWGSVIGPVMAGAVYDRTQSYRPLMWGLINLCLVTARLYVVLSNRAPVLLL
jgi:cyanate permease